MAFRKSSRAVNRLGRELTTLAPNFSIRELKAYQDSCQGLAQRLRPATWGDALVVTNRILKEVDKAGNYGDAEQRVVEAFHSGQLVDIEGAPMRDKHPDHQSVLVMCGVAAKKFRGYEYTIWEAEQAASGGSPT